jgi:hypothetical protein
MEEHDFSGGSLMRVIVTTFQFGNGALLSRSHDAIENSRTIPSASAQPILV